MEFGFTIKPDHSIERTVALARQAEAAGFAHGWLFDSHVIWRDPYPLLTLMAQATTTLRLGTCVTNPATREPSVTASSLAVLQELSGGRFDLGIGRGDSAIRVLGKPPTTMATLEEAVHVIRALAEGRPIEHEGATLQLPWSAGHRLPVWIAGYGPVALKMTGRIADGAMLQIADPDLVRWFVDQVRDSAREAGRDPQRGPDHGRRAGPRRRPGRRPRPGPLVPGPRREPRRGPRQQVPGRAARGAHPLHPRPRGLRLPPPRRGRQLERRVRDRRHRRPLRDRRRRRRPTSPSSASSPRRASTSSTCTS